MRKELLQKYLEGRCSKEEANEVLKWINTADSINDVDAELMEIWKVLKLKAGDSKKWSRSLEKVHEKIHMEELYGSLNMEESSKMSTKLRPPQKIPNSPSPQRISKFNYFIPTLFFLLFALSISIGFWQYSKTEEMVPTVVEIVKSTNKGQKLNVQLADGTKVILNSESELTFLEDFGTAERIVNLSGEAFFDVAKDTIRPFRVISGTVTTTAIGTSFNVNAFPKNDNIEVALVSGKVSIENKTMDNKSSLMLMPGEMATITKNINFVNKTAFDFNEIVAWKNGIIFFKDANYFEMVNKLEHWYGVTIHSNKVPDPDWKFSGRFEKESLENVLMALKFGHKLTFEIKGKEVYLKF